MFNAIKKYFQELRLSGINLRGKNIVVTGVFDCGTHRYCHALIKKAGGRAFERVCPDTDILVIGNRGSKAWVTESAGRKIIKMQRNRGIMISENDFLAVVSRNCNQSMSEINQSIVDTVATSC